MKQLNLACIKVISILFLLLPIISIAAEQKATFEITPLIGYRFGGDFDTNTSTIKLEEGTNYGLIFAWPFAPRQQGEFLISHSNTNLNGLAVDNASLSNNGLGVTYFHLGGNVPVSDGALPLWVTGGLGLTHLSPEASDLSDETRFSMNIGLNTKLELTKSISIRLGGRLYGTFFNSDSALFCGSEVCKIYISSDLWIQSEVNAGVTFRF